MKKTKRHFKIILMVFLKNIYFEQMWDFGPKNCTFLILHNIKGKEVHPANGFKIS